MRISDWSSDVCSSDLKFALHFAGGRPARNRPDEGNTMSNGNGVTATLGNAAESFADRAKEIGSAVTKRASKAVKSAKKTAKQAEKAASKNAGKDKKAVTRRVTKADRKGAGQGKRG